MRSAMAPLPIIGGRRGFAGFTRRTHASVMLDFRGGEEGGGGAFLLTNTQYVVVEGYRNCSHCSDVDLLGVIVVRKQREVSSFC